LEPYGLVNLKWKLGNFLLLLLTTTQFMNNLFGFVEASIAIELINFTNEVAGSER
jgi:hypothetical protein